jgi:hypothetical protein
MSLDRRTTKESEGLFLPAEIEVEGRISVVLSSPQHLLSFLL